MKVDKLSATHRGVPARWLISHLEQCGVSGASICCALDLDDASLITDSGIMTTQTYLEVFNWAARTLHSPLLGAQVAEAVNFSEYGILGHLVRNGPSLREGFDFMEKYHCISYPDFNYRLRCTGHTAVCHYEEADIQGIDSRQDINFCLALIVKGIRERAGPSWQPIKISFTYSEPKDTGDHQLYFGNSLYFNQPENLVEFETAILDIPNPNADPSLLPILLSQANQLLDEQQTKVDIVRQVQLLITTSLGYKPVTTEAVAERMNVSVRHLHRLLAVRNTSFRIIKDETVLKVAKEALTKSDLSITAIAMKLNYSETSAFDRMFKKLAGLTPLQYRKQSSTRAG